MKPEERALSRAVKMMKWGGASLFLAANLYLAYSMSTAYLDGQRRGEKLHEER